MANENDKDTQAKKQQPAKQGQRPGNQGKRDDVQPSSKGEPAAAPNMHPSRQPASLKPMSPAKPGADLVSNANDRRPTEGRGPETRQPSRDGADEVFSQRVFDPDNPDTVPVRSGGGASRPVGGQRGRDTERSLGIGGGHKPPSQGSRPSSPVQQSGGGQFRSDSNSRTGRSPEPPRPASQPSRGNAGRSQPKRQQRMSSHSRSQDPMGMAGSQTGPAVPRQPAAATISELILPASITVREFAERMHRSPIEVIKTLMNYGMMVPITESIDFDTAQLIGEELGVTVTAESLPEPEVAEVVEEAPKTLRQRILAAEKEENLVIRPPVVTVLGHVDHGKTTLLDAIRETRVVEGEAGGITQHIGAYQVMKNERLITFLDTPGHEAFTAMRARGAQVTDIAVVVVAADDGVMPQTKEAISHVKAAQVPIIVALNKIDKPQANPERVKQELADNGVLIEEYGGDVMCVPVSAKFRRGIGDLLESILLVADIEPQKANPDGECVGTVIESRLDKTRGATATVLVQNGTLHVGDAIVTGNTYAKIRAMYNDKGEPIVEAAPAAPVQILGLAEVPVAGDTFKVVADERTARGIASEHQAEKRATTAAIPTPALTLETIFAQAEAGKVKELNLILKADVQGSIEPIANSLEKLGDEKLKVKILYQGTGNISESDVMLALASHAIILGFSVSVDTTAQSTAEAEGVDIRLYNIIYNIIEDVQKALTGLLEPVYKEVITGHAEVRTVFKVTKVGKVAGSYVTDGEISRNSSVRLKRAGQVVTEDKIATLKRFQEDVAEVKTGFECGINLHNFNDFETGDILETYKKERVR